MRIGVPSVGTLRPKAQERLKTPGCAVNRHGSAIGGDKLRVLVAMVESEPIVADVMLRRPKTLPADVTVAAARMAFENQSVQMLLLVDGSRFRGAVTAIPEDAEAEERASDFVDAAAPVVTQGMTVSDALARLEQRPSGRLVVVDGEDLVGLVCLAKDGVTFCGTPGAMS